jgi:hypothetical protein
MSNTFDTFSYKKIENNALQTVCFTPSHEGEYKLEFKWNEYKILEKTILIRTPGFSIANKVKITGDGATQAVLNKEAEFFIDCTRVEHMIKKGSLPKIFFTNLFNDLDETLISIIQTSRNIYKCNYIVEKSGN